MKAFILYQYEVAICLAAFSALYFLLWRKETNFQLRRFLLLTIVTVSLIIPMLDFTLSFDTEAPTMEYLAYIPNGIVELPDQIIYEPHVTHATQTQPINAWQVLTVVWLVGASIMLLRFGISFWKICKIYINSESVANGMYRLVNHPIKSFSFFKIIAINRNQANSKAKDHIFAHELGHSKRHHSYDVVYMELIKIIQWFNPISWMLSLAVKQNLEFLADQFATNSLYNKQEYQYAIVHHASNTGYQLLKSQFSKSNLKQRIIMMDRPYNSKVGLGKLMLLFPLITILLMSFSFQFEKNGQRQGVPEISSLFFPEHIAQLNDTKIAKIPISNYARQTSQKNLDNIPIRKSVLKTNIERIGISTLTKPRLNYDIESASSENVSMLDSVYHSVDKIPQPSTGDMRSFYKLLKSDLKYPKQARKKGIKGKVWVQFVVLKDGTVSNVKSIRELSPDCDAEAVRALSNVPRWTPGEHEGKKVNVRMTMPVPFGIKYPPAPVPITGIVKNIEGKPVVACRVVIEGSSLKTKTDLQGKFKIQPTPDIKVVKLIFSAQGYQSEVRGVPYGSFHVVDLKSIEGSPDYQKGER